MTAPRTASRLPQQRTEAMNPAQPKSGYLPSLDGWRALAILGVLMTHDLSFRIGRFDDAGFKGYGGYGVYLFFAISGILITTRILEEEAKIGRFDIKAFYIRRIFRIQPAALVYLSVVLVLLLVGIIHDTVYYWRGAVLFYTNFLFPGSDVTARGRFTGHFWTLAVEEHFYILLSLLLLFIRKHRDKAFAGMIVAVYVVQVIARHHGYYTDASPRRTYWVILYLMTPALLALLLRRAAVMRAAKLFLYPWVAYLGTFVVMEVDRMRHGLGQHFLSVGMLDAQSGYLFFGFALWIIATMLHPESLSTRFLELKPLRYLGRLSYSLYLRHLLFFNPARAEVGITSPTLLLLSERPWKYLASIAAAMLSYYLIEKPLVRMGHRLAPPATPGHRDLDVQDSRVS